MIEIQSVKNLVFDGSLSRKVRFLSSEEVEYVYVGRTRKYGVSVLGNPFRIGVDGTREEVIQKFRIWLWNEMKKKMGVYHELKRLVDIATTKDLVLVCHCHPQRCHAEVVKRAIEWLANNPDF